MEAGLCDLAAVSGVVHMLDSQWQLALVDFEVAELKDCGAVGVDDLAEGHPSVHVGEAHACEQNADLFEHQQVAFLLEDVVQSVQDCGVGLQVGALQASQSLEDVSLVSLHQLLYEGGLDQL